MSYLSTTVVILYYISSIWTLNSYKIITFINYSLTMNRMQRVKMRGVLSITQNSPSAIPQCGLSLLLLSLFINSANQVFFTRKFTLFSIFG